MKRLAEEAQALGWVVGPQAGTDRCSTAWQMKQHPSRAHLSSLCPSVDSRTMLRVVPSQRTKACRAFIEHSLHTQHQALAAPQSRQPFRDTGGRGCRELGAALSTPSLFLTHVSHTPAQSHQCKTGLSYWLEKSSTCLSQQPVPGNVRETQWALE